MSQKICIGQTLIRREDILPVGARIDLEDLYRLNAEGVFGATLKTKSLRNRWAELVQLGMLRRVVSPRSGKYVRMPIPTPLEQQVLAESAAVVFRERIGGTRSRIPKSRAKRQDKLNQRYAQSFIDLCGGRCAGCGRARLDYPGDVHVDHVISRHEAGTDTIGNLAPLCQTCNLVKSSASGQTGYDELRRILRERGCPVDVPAAQQALITALAAGYRLPAGWEADPC